MLGTVDFTPFCHCVRTRVNLSLLKWHLVEGPFTYDFTLHLRIRDHTAMYVKWPLGSILLVYRHIVSPTLNVNPTLFVILVHILGRL
jgi:hypothetical protein